MNFKVGQKVVCKNAESANTPAKGQPIPDGKVVQNEIYTIDYIEDWHDIACLGFEEIGTSTVFEYFDFEPLDYQFVSEVINKVKKEEIYEKI